MVVCCVISFIGSAIAPGSQSIYRLIVAQILIGFGFSSTALAYCVPSEILPKKWRPSMYFLYRSSTELTSSSGAIHYQRCRKPWRLFRPAYHRRSQPLRPGEWLAKVLCQSRVSSIVLLLC